ncbi:hypothetical protein D3C78_1642060 [compost metagenome]
MIADHHQRRVEIGLADEVGHRVVVDMLRAADVAHGEALRVADVHDLGAIGAQLLGVVGGDAFEIGHSGHLGRAERPVHRDYFLAQSQLMRSPLSTFSRVRLPPHTQPVSRA